MKPTFFCHVTPNKDQEFVFYTVPENQTLDFNISFGKTIQSQKFPILNGKFLVDFIENRFFVVLIVKEKDDYEASTLTTMGWSTEKPAFLTQILDKEKALEDELRKHKGFVLLNENEKFDHRILKGGIK